jgi:phosphoglycerate dehydrogenase-like enzyme
VQDQALLKKIAVLDDYQGVALKMADWSPLDRRATIKVFRDNIKDRDQLIERLKDFHIICVMRERTPLPREVLQALPNLELIASTSSRNASIDMVAAAELGIAVAWTDGLPYGTPELTWGLILSAIRRIPQQLSSFRQGGWQTAVGQDINGRTLGIVGLGKLGKAVAKVGVAFGMRVIAWSQNLDPEAAKKEGVVAVTKSELFSQSDVISIHMVLSERSQGIVGAEDLALMKPTAWLINASRGPLVNEAALVEVLKAGRIAGAALDTYDVEPLPFDHEFRRLPNVIATPHVGFVTEDTYQLFYGQTVENIIGWLDGKPRRTELASNER